MLILRVFGGLSLENAGCAIGGAAGQPRRLALLAVLAVAGEGGLGREQLCSLFWPESDTERSRGALNQALYALRRDVRAQDVIVGTKELRLNAAVIASDVGTFVRSLALGDPAAAVASYGGPFLDGVHVRGESEFERWAGDRRQAFATRYAEALEALASAATARDDATAAVEWGRRLNAAEPLNTRAALLLVQALDRAGDRGGAFRHGASHAALLRQELGIEPGADFNAVFARLRESPAPAIAPRPAESISATQTELTTLPPAMLRASRSTTDAGTRRAWFGLEARPPAWAVASLAAAVTVAALLIRTSSSSGALDERERILVVPLETTGGRGADSLRSSVTSLLATALEGTPHLQVVDPVKVLAYAPSGVSSDRDAKFLSEHFHARRYARGMIVQEGEKISMRASIRESQSAGAELSSVEANGSADSLFSVTNRLAAELLAAQYPANHRRLAQAAARSTRSLDAFKAYLAGDDAMEKKRYTAAVIAYQRAVRIDSGFALAWYRLSIAADWAPNDAVTDAADHAVRTSARLDDHERLLIQALCAWRHNRFDEAEQLYRKLTTNWRDDVDAHYQLAEVLFHSNPTRGRSFLESEAEFLQALAADPQNDETRLHLARIAAWSGNANRADSLLRPVIAATPDSQSLDIRVFRAAVVGNRTEFGHLAAAFENRSDDVILTSCTRVAVWVRDLDGAERLCRILTSSRRSPASRVLGHLYLAQLAMAAGDRSRARLELSQVPVIGRLRALSLRAWMETLPGIPHDFRAIAETREQLAHLDTTTVDGSDASLPWFTARQQSQRRFYLALLDGALGNAGLAARETRALRSQRSGPADTIVDNYWYALSAHAALAEGRESDALSLSVARYPASDEWPFVSNRFVHAAALAATGHGQDALDEYASFDGAYIFDLVVAAPAHFQRAAIFERDKRFAEARREYSAGLALWKHADPQLQLTRDTMLLRQAALHRQ